MDTLLNQLKEQDLELYQEIVADLLPSSDHRNNFIICGKLQEAIRARGWHLYQIRNDDLPEKPCFVSIYNPTEGIKEHDSHQNGEGSTEAEALCLAYLEAIEAVKG